MLNGLRFSNSRIVNVSSQLKICFQILTLSEISHFTCRHHVFDKSKLVVLVHKTKKEIFHLLAHLSTTLPT